MPESTQPKAPEYGVPALDKGLDILELLADSSGGLTQAEIAEATGRTASQIFRVLTTLERRGYLHRDRQSGLYLLSLQLFELAHRHEPLRGLLQAAQSPMRRLADATRQSCNLSVVDTGRVRVVAQVESPADFGFSVRVGSVFSLTDTATGSVLSAFAEPRQPDDSGSRAERSDGDRDTGHHNAAEIRSALTDGFVARVDSLQPGITDIVFPILRTDGRAIAALTVPYIATSFSGSQASEVTRLLGVTTREIADSLNI